MYLLFFHSRIVHMYYSVFQVLIALTLAVCLVPSRATPQIPPPPPPPPVPEGVIEGVIGVFPTRSSAITATRNHNNAAIGRALGQLLGFGLNAVSAYQRSRSEGNPNKQDYRRTRTGYQQVRRRPSSPRRRPTSGYNRYRQSG